MNTAHSPAIVKLTVSVATVTVTLFADVDVIEEASVLVARLVSASEVFADAVAELSSLLDLAEIAIISSNFPSFNFFLSVVNSLSFDAAIIDMIDTVGNLVPLTSYAVDFVDLVVEFPVE